MSISNFIVFYGCCSNIVNIHDIKLICSNTLYIFLTLNVKRYIELWETALYINDRII